LELFEMVLRAVVEVPLRVLARRDLEYVLVEHTAAVAPDAHQQAAGPREQNVSVLHDVLWCDICGSAVGVGGDTLPKLTDLDHGQRFPTLDRWMLLARKPVEVVRDLIERLHLPALRDRAEVGLGEAVGEEGGEMLR